MATGDRSRNIFDFWKSYDSVGMQQGRALTDDDYNEGERIRLEDQRRTRVDVIGPYGSPDTGFRIQPCAASEASVVDGAINFKIGPGTFYLGGLRIERKEEEHFQTQQDWLSNPGVNLSEGEARIDLVYLEAWEQPVSAVEDQELLEEALGGPDTSFRLRTMARVKVFPDVDTEDCAEAWKRLKKFWKKHGLGELSSEHELIPKNTHLKVGFETEGERQDLCSPEVAGGYLGAENQAIRVELTAENTFTWGFDNGAPLYRVDVENIKVEIEERDETRTVVTMHTPPKDQAHWPVAGQVVEILPFSARLPNGQPLAEEMREKVAGKSARG